MHPSAVTLIFPHQLFKKHPAVSTDRPIYLIEEFLFFNQYNFNKKKLFLHRASMQYYADSLTGTDLKIEYIEATEKNCDVRKLIPQLAKLGVKAVHYAHVADDWLQKRIASACKKAGITAKVYRTPNFLNSAEDVADYFDGRKTYFQTDFYTAQRKQRNILLEGKDKPLGGKWTYDVENRQKFSKNEVVPGAGSSKG